LTNGVNNNNNNNNTQALEDLLEKQWEQGGAFMMEQAQHFDSMIIFNVTISMFNLYFYKCSCVVVDMLISVEK